MASVSASEREERLTQLCELAGLAPEEAEWLLEATQWQLEEAVSLHFAGSEEEEQQAYREAAAVAVRDSDPSRPATAPLEPPPPPQRLDAEGSAVGSNSGTEEAGGWFGSVGRAFTNLGQAIMGVASEDFEHWFVCRYGAPTPSFSKVCFGEAVKQALQGRRLLLLWFHQEESTATEKLCREILQNELVLEIIGRSFSLWAGDVGRFEPGQIARQLDVSSFPALVVCRPLRSAFDVHSVFLEWPLGTFCQPIFRLSPEVPGQALSVDQAIAALTAAAEDHNDEVQANEEQQARRSSQLEAERRLREEQDREFQESLLQDQLAEVRRSEAALAAEAAPAEVPAATASSPPAGGSSDVPEDSPCQEEANPPERPDDAEEQETRRRARGAEILAEPEPAPAGASTAKLSLRLPSGERLQRVFRAEQRLEEVYEWAHCCRSSAIPASFELCTSFPTRALTERSADLASLGLVPSSALVLKPVDE